MVEQRARRLSEPIYSVELGDVDKIQYVAGSNQRIIVKQQGFYKVALFHLVACEYYKNYSK